MPPVDEVPPECVVLETQTISIDPYVRARIEDRPSYKPPIGIGDVIPGEAVAIVRASNDPTISVGALVTAHTGWATHATCPASSVTPVPESVTQPSLMLGSLGMPGLTAFAGLAEFGRMQPGDTLVVAAATGAVGSMVGQLANRAGLRTVGIVGGPEKCRAAIEHFGFDAAVDHRRTDFPDALQAATPNGIDISFETVGGRVFETVLPLLNRHARVLICGLVSQWGAEFPGASAQALIRASLDRSLHLHGFVVGDLAAAYRPHFYEDVPPLFSSGAFQAIEHRTLGLSHAPTAFLEMLAGAHLGKTLVQLD